MFCAIASSYIYAQHQQRACSPKRGLGWRTDEVESGQPEKEADGLWEMMACAFVAFVLAATDHM